jgi:type I restriction enzyme M protein
MNCAAAWMPASTRTMCWCCCSSNTSATNTRASRLRRSPFLRVPVCKDMVALKGKPDIGDQINKKIIAPLGMPTSLHPADFNDPALLGSGKEMVERLTNLIAIFENKALDFSKNRADGDDILGDAYEYLMRHFATESGKSKGQFYTPGGSQPHHGADSSASVKPKPAPVTTVYDPTCGSGSLLLKVGDAAKTPKVTLYGQEKDAATSGLARMNMILHNNPRREIKQGNTWQNPKFNGERPAQDFRLCGRQSAVFRQALEHRP